MQNMKNGVKNNYQKSYKHSSERIEMKNKFRAAALLFFAIALTGCAQRSVKNELVSLLANPGTASGSDLMLALCGWPTYETLTPASVDVDLAPDSGLRHGSGTARITARNSRITCSGVIGFTYSSVYMGGHGSGGSEIAIGTIKRESPLPPAISDPGSWAAITVGTKISGRLSETSARLPDGSFGDYYRLDVAKPDCMIRIRLEGEKGLNPKGCLYQNNRLESIFIDGALSPTFNVICVREGAAVLLVSALGKKGRYTILVEEPDDQTRSMMKPCRR